MGRLAELEDGAGRILVQEGHVCASVHVCECGRVWAECVCAMSFVSKLCELCDCG